MDKLFQTTGVTVSAADKASLVNGFWLGKLNTFGGSFVNAEMVLAFISSPEYRARFGQP